MVSILNYSLHRGNRGTAQFAPPDELALVRKDPPQYAVLQPVAVAPESVDIVLARLAADALPRLRATRGLIAFSALTNRRGGLVAFTSWETREAAETARTDLDTWFRQNAPGAVAEPADVLIGEVVAQAIGIAANEALVWRWQVDPPRVETVLTPLRDGFLPLIRATRGFCRCDLVVDRASGLLAAMSGFDSPETADRARDLVAPWSEQNAEILGNAPGNLETYSVSLRAVPSASASRPNRRWPFSRRSH